MSSSISDPSASSSASSSSPSSSCSSSGDDSCCRRRAVVAACVRPAGLFAAAVVVVRGAFVWPLRRRGGGLFWICEGVTSLSDGRDAAAPLAVVSCPPMRFLATCGFGPRSKAAAEDLEFVVVFAAAPLGRLRFCGLELSCCRRDASLDAFAGRGRFRPGWLTTEAYGRGA